MLQTVNTLVATFLNSGLFSFSVVFVGMSLFVGLIMYAEAQDASRKDSFYD